jgi:probable addiction module antidote protein
MTQTKIDPVSLPVFDLATYLDTDQRQALYLDEALETNDPAFIARCICDIVCARGMTQVDESAGLTRASLYKALSEDGNPEFATIMRVLTALGIGLVTRQGMVTENSSG